MKEMFQFSCKLPATALKIADIGSRGNQNYAPFFTRPGWEYVGMDMADEPQRWYHQREAALSEAQIIADVLWNGRQAHGGAVGKAGRKQDEVDVVWAACNAAYKKGMIDTAQDFCEGCRKARPERHKGSLRFWHGRDRLRLAQPPGAGPG